MKNINCDLETFSSVNLSKSGVYKYASSPDFEILLFGYSVDGGPVRVVDFTAGEQIPAEVLSALTDPTVTKWAFNAQFERVCLSRWLGMPMGEYLEPDSWRCTMVWSATLGLPLSLEGVGAVLGLEKQKLKEGKDLIRYFCTPAKDRNGNSYRHHPEDAPEKWERFKAYNLRDVETEMSIQQKLARFPVPENIWGEYHLDQEINDRGIGVDMELVRQAIGMDAHTNEKLTAQMRRLTSLTNPNSVQQMKQWLADNGLEMDSLGKKEVAALLKTAPAPLSEVLLLRQQLAKSSVKKYTAMETAVCPDGRARGMFQFYGANRTGRWAGRIIQLQNLPQNHLPDLTEARSVVRSGDLNAVEMLCEDVPDTLSQLIRTAHLRQKGKIAELALGYGGSVGALKAMGALNMGVPEEKLKPLVDAWRSSNPNITNLWWDVDDAAKTCVSQRTTTSTHGITFSYQSGMMFITLPSGRKLVYVKPKIGENRFGGESVTYEGVGGQKKWLRLESYGPKFVENIVKATARDILTEAMLRLDAKGYKIVMHVHDEAVIEAPPDTSLEDICETMAIQPKWADGLLLRADGYECDFYKKD